MHLIKYVKKTGDVEVTFHEEIGGQKPYEHSATIESETDI